MLKRMLLRSGLNGARKDDQPRRIPGASTTWWFHWRAQTHSVDVEWVLEDPLMDLLMILRSSSILPFSVSANDRWVQPVVGYLNRERAGLAQDRQKQIQLHWPTLHRTCCDVFQSVWNQDTRISSWIRLLSIDERKEPKV